jgi:L-lactate dehydrogenase (cytochrome)
MTIITSIEDLRVLAKRRVPRMFYDYVDSGSWTESTYRANSDRLSGIQFRQRVALNIANRNLATTMAGQSASMPVALAPTGLTGMQHADGEILAARAAERFGVPFTLSTVSICSIEDIAENVSKPFWFQLYMMRNRQFITALIARARAAKCSALVLTLDLQIQGQRHKDLKNRLTAPPRLTAANVLNMMTKPRWCRGMLGTRRHAFGNIVGHVEGVGNMTSFASWVAEQFDPTLSWEDVKWIRRQWDGKLIIKGIMDVEDARLAAASGADALIVSNHGGRQLDGAPSSIDALPDIVDAVGHLIEVHMDSGIRTGQDILRALALGAKGVFVGRAFLYGLGAMGEAGVTKCLEILHKELDLTMAFCGLTDVNQAGEHILVPGSYRARQPDTWSRPRQVAAAV